jgi:hypothetical protein
MERAGKKEKRHPDRSERFSFPLHLRTAIRHRVYSIRIFFLSQSRRFPIITDNPSFLAGFKHLHLLLDDPLSGAIVFCFSEDKGFPTA